MKIDKTCASTRSSYSKITALFMHNPFAIRFNYCISIHKIYVFSLSCCDTFTDNVDITLKGNTNVLFDS